jgi:transcription-repair coupling factor (superfamily II helicase)
VELIRRNIYFDAGVLYPTVFGSGANPLCDGLFSTLIFADEQRCDESWFKAMDAMRDWAARKKFPDPELLLSNIFQDLPADAGTVAKVLHLDTMAFSGADDQDGVSRPLPGAVNMPVRMLPPLPLDLGEISRILHKETGQGRVAIISRYKKRLLSFLDDEGIRGVNVVEGAVRGGFRLDQGPCSVFTDAEMFQRRPDKKRVAQRTDKDRVPLAAPSDIEKGDYIVHVDHGVGKYNGLVTQTSSDGVTRDFFSISYARGDSLFVPVEQIDRIEKYIGAKAAPPKVYPLHSARWGKVKQKIRKKIEDMASTLYALYNERELMKGYAFSEDNLFMQELDESFPYEETDDQLHAIDMVKDRMQQPKPMDHLVYGDVGYGKTEVAVRAAFKAALDKKQVALLAPTTILTQQHGRTFHERLARFPVTVEVLNRFRTAKEKKDILKRLAAGEIDIIIGTHALLSDGVRFKDLGLLIVDEEQRFGVKHKERLKMMRINVDVLTLTATPIPRTLHMSLIGLRDVSLIETPPEDRKAVKTFVEEWNPNMLVTGIERELLRGGQVFFVHNNIDTIPEVQAFLENVFPDARLAVMHGRMSANQIENTMEEFMKGEHDILLSTTIIENGLDIPNVNTMVVNGAENFGLGQMYQLRGRVGRSFRQSYAYFFYSPYKTLNENAQKRLQALRDFADLGSGYRLAMKDLEIRGAGNLLGGEQHGFITEIGFNLYCKMLAESVDKVRGRVVPDRPPAEVDLCISAFIPEDYVPDTGTRTDFYKRLVSATQISRVARIADEIKDRYGPFPRPLRHFITQVRIKLLAQRCGVATLKTHPHSEMTDMTFHDEDTHAFMRTVSWPADFHCELVYLPDRLRFIHEGKQPGQVLTSLRGFLDSAVESMAPSESDSEDS